MIFAPLTVNPAVTSAVINGNLGLSDSADPVFMPLFATKPIASLPALGARRFVNEWNAHGPAHHCTVGVGHIADKIKKLGLLLGIETICVC